MLWVDSGGGSHELPKYTRALAKRFAKADEQPEGDARWRAQLDVVRECIGETADVLHGTKLDDIDLMELEAAYSGIRSAYESPKREADMRRIEEQLDMLDVAKLQTLADVLGTLDSRQGFKNVK